MGYTTNGSFSVRSAYYLQQTVNRQMEGECSGVAAGVIDWKQMWNLNVPMKIKLFVWKAVHDILPTTQNLFRRRVVESDVLYMQKRG